MHWAPTAALTVNPKPYQAEDSNLSLALAVHASLARDRPPRLIPWTLLSERPCDASLALIHLPLALAVRLSLALAKAANAAPRQ